MGSWCETTRLCKGPGCGKTIREQDDFCSYACEVRAAEEEDYQDWLDSLVVPDDEAA